MTLAAASANFRFLPALSARGAALAATLVLGSLCPVLGPAAYNAPDISQPRSPNTVDRITQDIGIDQKLNGQVDLDTQFTDHTGKVVRLRDVIRNRPVILNLVYFNCPRLCTVVLNGLVTCMNMMNFQVGEQFDVLTVSFDEREKTELAAAKRTSYLGQLKGETREKAPQGWTFLTGDKAAIAALTDQVGFRFVWDKRIEQYAHAAGIIVLTPDGRVSRYFFGNSYSPRDVELGLTEASKGRVGGVAEKLMLLCYEYDASHGKYGLRTIRLIQFASAAVLLALGSFIGISLYRERRAARRPISA